MPSRESLNENAQTYDELGTFPNPGDHAQVVRLGSTAGLLVQERYLAARRAGASGVIKGWIAGHGGDAWWLEHGDGSIGAYVITEIGPSQDS